MTFVTVVGNLAKAPDLRFTKDGKAVASFSIAENHSKKDPAGNWVDDGTTWRRVTVWGEAAEALTNACDKGTRVIVYGNERMTEFEGKDGNPRQSLEVTAKTVGVVPRIPRDQQQRPAQDSQQWQSQPQQSQQWGQSEPQWEQPAFDQGQPPF